MQEFLNYLVLSIVKNPDDVKVEEIIDGTTFNYQISVNPEDMGLVIGKEGRIIRSIRALAKSKAIKDGIMINIELLEPEGSTRNQAPAKEPSEVESSEADDKQDETPEAPEEDA